MAQLTSDAIISFETNADVASYPVLAAAKIYRGSALGFSAGYVRQLVAGDAFAGFAEETMDNTSGASGALNVYTRLKGAAALTVTAGVITSVGSPVYASDGATFTLASNGGANTLIGTAKYYVAAGSLIVSFKGSVV